MTQAGRPPAPVDDPASVSARIRAHCRARGLDWPAEIEHVAVLTSTNDRLRQRARAGAAPWTVIVADTQTAGRGRQGRRWASPPGNLFMSVLLRPEPPGARWGVVPLAAGVAVAEAVAEEGLEAGLKWPNDVMVAGRKVGGILAEATSGADGLESIVLGIGINVATRPMDLAPETASGVTCLEEELARAVDRVALTAAVLARLTVWYHALAREGPRAVQSAWRAHAVAWWGRAVEAQWGERRLRGIVRDLDEGGALILELEDGTRAVLHSGEVHDVRPARD